MAVLSPCGCQYIELRHRFKAQRGTAQLTLLIEAIPPEAASTDTELRRLFDKYFPGKIHSYVGCTPSFSVPTVPPTQCLPHFAAPQWSD